MGAFLEGTQVPVALESVVVAVLVVAAWANTVLQSLVGMDTVGDPVVGLASVLEWLVVAVPNPDNIDWIASVPSM